MKLKTILIIGLAAMTCATSVSARARKKKPTMAEVPQNPYKPVDGKTFSYAFGVMQGEGLRNYLIQREGVDSLYISEAVKGLNAEYSEEEVPCLRCRSAHCRDEPQEPSEFQPKRYG